MDMSDYIALFSLLVSSIALIYSLVSNTKRFELADQRGNRHPALDCLVNVYVELKHPKEKDQAEYIKKMQMRFTSVMFKIVDPVLWNKQRAKTIKMIVPTDYCKSELQETYGER